MPWVKQKKKKKRKNIIGILIEIVLIYRLLRVVSLSFFFFFFLSFCLFVFSRAAPSTYGGSQARGLIGAVGSSLRHSHSNLDLSRVFNLYHSSRQSWILNPLIEARDQTRNLVFLIRFVNHWATTGTLQYLNNVKSSYSWTQDVLAFISIFKFS